MSSSREERAERAREGWARKDDASRREHVQRVSDAVTASYYLTARERELARDRAGKPCPVCSQPAGKNGMCLRSPACIDEAMAFVNPRYRPPPR